jgi:hypothetical protein
MVTLQTGIRIVCDSLLFSCLENYAFGTAQILGCIRLIFEIFTIGEFAQINRIIIKL